MRKEIKVTTTTLKTGISKRMADARKALDFGKLLFNEAKLICKDKEWQQLMLNGIKFMGAFVFACFCAYILMIACSEQYDSVQPVQQTTKAQSYSQNDTYDIYTFFPELKQNKQ